MITKMKGKLATGASLLFWVNPFVPKQTRVCRTYGIAVEENLSFLQQSQWWPPSKLLEYQERKLSELVRHAYENAPYYRQIMEQRGLVPEDIQNLSDLPKLPLLTKKEIRENYPEGMLARNATPGSYRIARTGASTGEPLVFIRDYKSQDMAWAAFLRFYDWIGYEWGDRVAVFWRQPILSDEESSSLGLRLERWLVRHHVRNEKRFDAFRLGSTDLDNYAEELARSNPQIIRGYASAVSLLARYCKQNGISEIRPRAITTTAEMLFRRDRRLIEEQFGCKVFDQYACGETMSMTFECPSHSGMHVATEHCVVEFVDEDGDPADQGRVVVTDLDNYAMPFIRYLNGDMGHSQKQLCPCGRGLPLIDYIDGRVFGMIEGVNGNIVHGEFFADLFEELGWLERYAVTDFEAVQRSKEELEWNIVCQTSPSREEIDRLIALCMKYLGQMEFKVNFVNEIPLTPSGKRRFTRLEIAQEERKTVL